MPFFPRCWLCTSPSLMTWMWKSEGTLDSAIWGLHHRNYRWSACVFCLFLFAFFKIWQITILFSFVLLIMCEGLSWRKRFRMRYSVEKPLFPTILINYRLATPNYTASKFLVIHQIWLITNCWDGHCHILKIWWNVWKWNGWPYWYDFLIH